MKELKIKVCHYRAGNEQSILDALNQSRDPLVIKVEDFPGIFDLDYYANAFNGETSYRKFDEQGKVLERGSAPFPQVLEWIKENQGVRIFGQSFSRQVNEELVEKIQLWKQIPFRPRYFKPDLGKALYFFGGKNSVTNNHYDRELNSNLHICLYGQKRFRLFNQSENQHLYKLPFMSDSAVDLQLPVEEIIQTYPDLVKVRYFDVTLDIGDMLYMPKNCWHHIEYLSPSASATYAFYPKIIDQYLGFISGVFYLGFSFQGLRLDGTKIYKNFARHYIYARGVKRWFYQLAESVTAIALFPICAAATFYNFVWLNKRPY